MILGFKKKNEGIIDTVITKLTFELNYVYINQFSLVTLRTAAGSSSSAIPAIAALQTPPNQCLFVSDH